MGEGTRAVTVLLPVVNEVDSLNQTIQIIREGNSQRDIEYLIVMSQKCSSEVRANINTLVMSDPSNIRAMTQSRPRLGGALIDGFEAARGDVILMMASDLETDPNAVSAILDMADNHPETIVATTRWRGSGAGFEGYGHAKRTANWIFQTSIGALFKSDLTDLTYGYRLFPRRAVVGRSWTLDDHGFLLESLLRPLRDGWPAVEVPVRWTPRIEGESNNSWRYYSSYFKISLRLRFGAR